jgi:hypothetical protein
MGQANDELGSSVPFFGRLKIGFYRIAQPRHTWSSRSASSIPLAHPTSFSCFLASAAGVRGSTSGNRPSAATQENASPGTRRSTSVPPVARLSLKRI